MTSTALSFNRIHSAFKRVFKNRLVNSILIIAACAVASVIGVSSTFITYGSKSIDVSAEFLTLFAAITIIVGLYSVANAIGMFKEIYKKQSCDAYFSTPIKREEYFIANYFYGMVVNILCYVVSAVIFVITMKSVNSTFDTEYIINLLAFPFALLAIYSAFVMCAVISGKRIQYILLCLICLFCTSTFIAGIIVDLHSIWGFSFNYIPISAVSPVENAIIALNIDKAILLIAISVIETILMFFAGLIAFKHREAECAEVALSGKVIPFILQAVLVGAAYYYLKSGRLWLDLVLGVVIATLMTMAFCGIFYKKAFTKPALTTLACVCAVCALFTISVNSPIYDNFVKYVPDEDQIESVEIGHNSRYYDDFYGLAGLLNNFEEQEYNYLTFTDRDAVNDAVALHKASITDKAMANSNRMSYNVSIIKTLFFDLNSYDSYIDSYDINYCIKYNLKNGKTVTRKYTVSDKYIQDEYVRLYQNEESIDQLVENCFGEECIAMQASIYNNEKYETKVDENDENIDYSYPLDFSSNDIEFDFDSFDLGKFKEAYKKDLATLNDRQFAVELQNNLNGDPTSLADSSDYSSLVEISLYSLSDTVTPEQRKALENLSNYERIGKLENLNYYGEDDYIDYNFVHFNIYDYNQNTINYLKSIGIE